MVRRSLAWSVIAVLFLLLYVGVPWVGLALDRSLGVPPWPSVVAWIGVVLFVLGAAGLAWCLTLFVRVGRGTPNPMMPPQALVTVGPFAWTRNPIVLSHAAAILGVCLILGSVSATAIVIVLAVPVHVAILHEERTLEARFGEAYRAYKSAVPRWMPRPVRALRGERTR